MIKIGIIGAGPNATGHAKYYHKSPRTKVAAIADPAFDLAEKLAAECGARPVRDFTEFLDSVDAVVVASPNFLHRDQAAACARAGKHVFCEKPMGINAAEAREIETAVREAGVRSAIGFSVRWGANILTLKRLADEGELGALVSIWSRRVGFFAGAANPQGWRSDPAKSGGLLYEINIHELDWMMWLGGPVRAVFAQTRALRPGHPRANDHLWFTLMFANDAVGAHEGSWYSAAINFHRGAAGSDAAAFTGEWGGDLFLCQNGENRQPCPLDSAGDSRAAFLDSIEHGVPTPTDAAWGLKVMETAEAIFQSAATNQVVTFPQNAA